MTRRIEGEQKLPAEYQWKETGQSEAYSGGTDRADDDNRGSGAAGTVEDGTRQEGDAMLRDVDPGTARGTGRLRSHVRRVPTSRALQTRADAHDRGTGTPATDVDHTRVNTPASLLMTVDQACETLQVSRTRLFAMFAAHELPRVKVGRVTRVKRADIESYVAKL